MFEIAWCVMLYFSVLVLEFSPAILEHPWFRHPIFKTILDWLHRLTLPLVIAGIILSTLHQSSLGSLFLIMPHRVHPLWYSPWIPYMFFTSAIAAGMLALIVEGFLVERWFKRGMHFDLLTNLGKWAILPLGLYLALRLSDLVIRDVLPGAIDGSWQSLLFLAEILLCGIFPIILLSIKKIRETQEGLLTAAILGVLGIMSQRMSLSMFTMYRAEGTSYLPSLGETAIAFAIPATAVLLYLFFAENLSILGEQADAVLPAPVLQAQVSLSKGAESEALEPAFGGLAVPSSQNGWWRAVAARRSGFAIFVIALALPVLSLKSSQPPTPVTPAAGWETLHIDGNKSGYVVNFSHADHQERLVDENTGESECQVCHHLNLPDDEASACSKCHTDYYQSSSIFDHSLHQQTLGGNGSCLECHDVPRTRPTDNRNLPGLSRRDGPWRRGSSLQYAGAFI